MTDREDFRPGGANEHARVVRAGDRWTLVFVRELRHSPSEVWSALTDPDQLREWSPFDPDRDLGSTGTAMLTLLGADEKEPFECEIRQAEPSRLLEYGWGSDVLRWELEAIDSGCRLTLRQTIDDRSWVPKVAAGWHIALDVADLALAGRPIGRIIADEAKRFGWERLNAEYAERFGIENTGWPETISRERG